MKWQRILVLLLIVPLGWLLIRREERQDHAEQAGPKSVEVSVDGGSISYVAAEDWVTAHLGRSSDDIGWIALPHRHSGELYRSPVNTRISTPDDCRDCHADIVDSFLQTAHARTSAYPTEQSILGSFVPPENLLETAVDGFFFEMAESDGEFLQVVHHPADEEDVNEPGVVAIPIAFVVGSGNHGQSYLHWAGDQLCVMHVSYFSEFDRWTNAPGGYLDGTADYARPVTSRCVDCHNTWFGHDPRSINRFDTTNPILGVTCVRCHGPAHEHMEFHRRHPDQFDPHFIVNPSNLEHQRNLEVCAQCHSGGGELLRPAFSYLPGEPLQEYLDIDLEADDGANDDPHSANQLGRLMRSRCFQASGTLDCADCHDPHRQERGDTELFSRRCQSCHDSKDCGVSERVGFPIDSRCIECHMPSRRDADVTAAGADDDLLPLLRDHMIGIWPDVSQRVEERITAELEETGTTTNIPP